MYAADAEVAHPTRGLLALLGKQYRVGRGRYRLGVKAWQAQQGAAAGVGPVARALVVRGELARLRPPSRRFVRDGIRRCDLAVTPIRFARVWAAGWMCRISTVLGTVAESCRTARE